MDKDKEKEKETQDRFNNALRRFQGREPRGITEELFNKVRHELVSMGNPYPTYYIVREALQRLGEYYLYDHARRISIILTGESQYGKDIIGFGGGC